MYITVKRVIYWKVWKKFLKTATIFFRCYKWHFSLQIGHHFNHFFNFKWVGICSSDIWNWITIATYVVIKTIVWNNFKENINCWIRKTSVYITIWHCNVAELVTYWFQQSIIECKHFFHFYLYWLFPELKWKNTNKTLIISILIIGCCVQCLSNSFTLKNSLQNSSIFVISALTI